MATRNSVAATDNNRTSVAMAYNIHGQNTHEQAIAKDIQQCSVGSDTKVDQYRRDHSVDQAKQHAIAAVVAAQRGIDVSSSSASRTLNTCVTRGVRFNTSRMAMKALAQASTSTVHSTHRQSGSYQSRYQTKLRNKHTNRPEPQQGGEASVMQSSAMKRNGREPERERERARERESQREREREREREIPAR
jgi:hypothetical protein